MSFDSNPYWDYIIDEYVLPNGKTAKYYFAHTPGSTMIVPILDDGTFVFTRQFRYLNNEFSIELPGGGLKSILTPEANASMELQQETGYVAKELQLLGKFNPCNGLTDEICWVYLAKGLVQVEQTLDESEEIEVLILKREQVIDKIKNGEIWDGMTLASWCLFSQSFLL